MPRSDVQPDQRAAAIVRFKRTMRRMALLSLAAAIVAVAIVASGDDQVHIHMLIATGLGVGLTMLLGTALMSLVFLSSAIGHDDEATRKPENDQP